MAIGFPLISNGNSMSCWLERQEKIKALARELTKDGTPQNIAIDRACEIVAKEGKKP